MTQNGKSKYVRASEARKRKRGLREIRVWVPDTADAVSAVRALAANLVANDERADDVLTDQKPD
jgi:hypothetical protein